MSCPTPELGKAALEALNSRLCDCTEGPESGEGLDPEQHGRACGFRLAMEEFLEPSQAAEPRCRHCGGPKAAHVDPCMVTPCGCPGFQA